MTTVLTFSYPEGQSREWLIILVLIFSFLLPEMSVAQSTEDSDPIARKILDDLKSEYESYQALELTFDLIMDFPDQQPEKQKGKAIQSGDNYYLELQDQAIYCDGETVWVHLKDNNEVQINDAEDSEEEDSFLTPQDMMRIYESGKYYYAVTNSTSKNGQQLRQIEFKPLEEDSEYRKLRLTVNISKNKMKLMEIFSKDGSKYTLEVGTLVPNRKYRPEMFAFNAGKFPGIHIEDLRF